MTISGHDFDQNSAALRRALYDGPIFIVDGEEPRQVLLSIEEYDVLSGKRRSLAESLGMRDAGDIEFDPPRLGTLFRDDVDLT